MRLLRWSSRAAPWQAMLAPRRVPAGRSLAAPDGTSAEHSPSITAHVFQVRLPRMVLAFVATPGMPLTHAQLVIQILS